MKRDWSHLTKAKQSELYRNAKPMLEEYAGGYCIDSWDFSDLPWKDLDTGRENNIEEYKGYYICETSLDSLPLENTEYIGYLGDMLDQKQYIYNPDMEALVYYYSAERLFYVLEQIGDNFSVAYNTLDTYTKCKEYIEDFLKEGKND